MNILPHRPLAPGLFVILAALLASACSESSVDVLSPSDVPPHVVSSDLPATSIDTLLSAVEVLAGETVQIQCRYLDKAGDMTTGPATTLSVTPEFATQAHAETYSIRPTKAGTYTLRCAAKSGAFADESPVSLKVRPNLPHSWNVDLQDTNCFQQNLHLPLYVTVLDAYGNIIPRPNVSATVIPDTGVDGDALRGLRFAHEGNYDLTISLNDRTVPGASIEPVYRNVHVDQTGPVVTIGVPARGEMLLLGDEETTDVTVSGVAVDAMSAIVGLNVNDTPQPVPGDTFTVDIDTTHPSRWGLSVVSGTAEDACGNVGHIAHSFLRGGDYYAPALYNDDDAKAVNGVIVQLNQDFINDHDRSDIDDIATLLESVVGALDLNSRIPAGTVLKEDPWVEDCAGDNAHASYSIARHPNPDAEITLDRPTLHELRAIDGGFEFKMNLTDLSFPLEVHATANTCVVTEITWADITLGATLGLEDLAIQGTFGLTYWDGVPQVDLSSFHTEVIGLSIDLDCGALDFACGPVTDGIEALVEGTIVDALADKVRSDGGAFLAKSLQSFNVEQDIELPSPLNMVLTTVVQPESIVFCGEESDFDRPDHCQDTQAAGSAMVGMTTQFFPATRGDSIPEDARGALATSSEFPTFTNDDDSFAVALRDDTLNQLFWALWYGGGLDLNISDSPLAEQLPAGVESLSITATLPPVVMPGTETNVIDIGLGDLLIEGRLDMATLMADEGTPADSIEPYYIDLKLYVSMIMGGAIDVDPTTNQLNLIVDPTPEFYFHILDLNDASFAQESGAVLQGLVPQVLPELLTEAVGKVSLPTIDLGEVANLPEGAVWELRNPSLTHSHGYLKFTGAVGLVE